MPSPRPPYRQGHYYHFYNRGCDRSPIFHTEADYLYAIRKIKTYAHKYSIAIIAYCLMPNHYHMLVRQDDLPEARLIPQRVFNGYVKRYNNLYSHSGTIFQGPYRVKVVDKGEYLTHLCRYIHANPVDRGLVTDAEEWPFANYLEWVQKRPGALVDREFVQARFTQPDEYAAFVRAYTCRT